MAGSGRLVDTPLADVEVDDLLSRVRAGDMDAYGELYSRYSAFAGKVARRVSRRNADDLVSESFRRILVTMQNGGGPTKGFGPYLATVIRSVGAGQALPFEETQLAVVPETPVESPDVDPRVSTAYLSLPQQWQDAIWYTDVEGLKPRHAAPIMGLASANAFSALRKRARAGLRSAYLTQVVDEACNEEVRQALWMMAEGVLDADVVDDVVDQHIADCDRCGAVAWRVAAVPGGGLAVGPGLAPAVLAAQGFVPGATLLPVASVGAGVAGSLAMLPGRLWRAVAGNSTAAVAGGAVTAAVAVGVVTASVVALGGPDDEAAAPTSTVAAVVTTEVSSDDGGPADSASPASSAAASEVAPPTAPRASVPSSSFAEDQPDPELSPPDAPTGASAAAAPAADPSPTAPAPPVSSTTTQPAPSATVFGPAPPATVPSTAPPVTTAPATTVPPTTVPATTAPATAVPPETVPTTVPPTTVPPEPTPVTVVPPATTVAPTTVVPTTVVPTTVPPTTVPVTQPPVTTVPPATEPPENCVTLAGGLIEICLPPGISWPPPWWPAGT